MNTGRGVRSPAGRYDERHGLGRAGVAALAVVLGLVLLLGLFRLYERFGQGDVRHQLRGYAVVSDAETVVTVAVFARVPAVCTVAARGRDGGEVGTAQVDVAAGDRTVEVRVATRARATTGVVRRCVRAQ